MLRMDGFGVLAWLQTRPKLKDIPVVVLTSSPDDADRGKAFKLGAVDYRIEPGKPSDLAALLQELCARWLSHEQPSPTGSERQAPALLT